MFSKLKNCQRWLGLCVVATLVSAHASSCPASFTFLGPTPYLSAADSPFAEHLGGPNFFLEDFEDGELNTPGIFQPDPFIISTVGVVLDPGENTDSVDSDDGTIDGWGRDGHSLRSVSHLVGPILPHQRNELNLFFEFDQAELGFSPNAFAFVWTDGPHGVDFNSGFSLTLDIRDEYFERQAVASIMPPNDMARDGGTADDVFFGIVSDVAFASVILQATYFGNAEPAPYFEIDHVQYGLFEVPEPRSLVIVAFALFSFRIHSIRTTHRAQ